MIKKPPPIKLSWFDRAIQVHNYHVSQCRDEPDWTLEKTAVSLNRSTGSISQDMLIATWSRSHERQIRKCRTLKDAIAFIQSKKRELIEEIEL